MANFTQMSNSFAQQYLAQQEAQNSSYYTNIKNTLMSDTGGDFLPDRMTAFVGTNPNIPNSSYVVIIEPSFFAFPAGSTSHQAASMISYYADGKASYCGTEVVVDHNPYEVASLTLIECDTSGQKVATTLDRPAFSSTTVQDLANQMSTATMDPALFETINSFPTSSDLAAMVNLTLDTAINDSYAAPLYPDSGRQNLLDDSAIPVMFSQAAAMKTAANNPAGSNLRIVCCCSTSCNGCSSSSTSVVIKLPTISW